MAKNKRLEELIDKLNRCKQQRRMFSTEIDRINKSIIFENLVLKSKSKKIKNRFKIIKEMKPVFESTDGISQTFGQELHRIYIADTKKEFSNIYFDLDEHEIAIERVNFLNSLEMEVKK